MTEFYITALKMIVGYATLWEKITKCQICWGGELPA